MDSFLRLSLTPPSAAGALEPGRAQQGVRRLLDGHGFFRNRHSRGAVRRSGSARHSRARAGWSAPSTAGRVSGGRQELDRAVLGAGAGAAADCCSDAKGGVGLVTRIAVQMHPESGSRTCVAVRYL